MRHRHTHECHICKEDFPCGGSRVDNWDGWPEVLCSTETDPDFEHHVCEDCYESQRLDACKHGVALDENGSAVESCEDCRDNAAEAAYERSLSDFYGGSGPQTVQEHYNAAAEQKRKLDR